MRRRAARSDGDVEEVRAVRVAIVLIGDELLAGHTRDANAHWMAQRLTALGHRLRRVVIVPDEAHMVHEALDSSALIAEVVLVSGGLGPTHDDRTTEIIADRFARNLVVDANAWGKLVARYGSRAGVTEAARESARKMVTVPEGAEVLDNPVGAACGYVLREGGIAYVVMPGVPAELQAIFDVHVVGKILPHAERVGLVEVDVEMAEAMFAKELGLVAQRFADLEIGSYPHFGERRVTLRFKGDEKRAREALEAFFGAIPEAKARVVRGPIGTL
ncbi:MAG TPA: molybdopterin-binding protein [Candidatus Thermoplasmatota archaeon]|nr:molybdopterin-binding protein [Candidatus Thermoplasmatota archaeon]